MNLGIMQPYFFPYLGYFSLIKNTDSWIVFDTPQFMRQGWIERNRILDQIGGWQYIMVPLEKFRRETPINQVKIKQDGKWQQRMISQLNHYKKKAPYFNAVTGLLQEGLFFETDSISALNVHLLDAVCRYLEIPFHYSVLSEMSLDLGQVDAPDEWALQISKCVGADAYINPPSGKEFYDRSKYEKNGIDIRFLCQRLDSYPQLYAEFIPGLSILDVMMFNDAETIRTMLDNFELA
jgi:hypothetical protein